MARTVGTGFAALHALLLIFSVVVIFIDGALGAGYPGFQEQVIVHQDAGSTISIVVITNRSCTAKQCPRTLSVMYS